MDLGPLNFNDTCSHHIKDFCYDYLILLLCDLSTFHLITDGWRIYLAMTFIAQEISRLFGLGERSKFMGVVVCCRIVMDFFFLSPLELLWEGVHFCGRDSFGFLLPNVFSF